MSYLRPDVYIEKVASKVSPPSRNADIKSTPVFFGVMPRGEVGVPTLVTNWTEVLDGFAKGILSPFMANSDLSYALYGYYQNGGGRAYIVRVAGAGATKATATIPASTGVVFHAKDEGEWANDKLKVKIETQTSGNFKITATYDNNLSEVFEELSNDVNSANYFVTVLEEKSSYLTVEAGTLAEGEGTLAGGSSDLENLTDTDFTGDKGLKAIDVLDDYGLLVAPGQTSITVINALLEYADTKKTCFALVELPMGTTPTDASVIRDSITGENGACYFPWIKITDPASPTGKTKVVPPTGHIAGVYARVDRERGGHKAPAGIEAQLRGVLGVETGISSVNIGTLNDKGVNCLLPKAGRGVLIWGARSLSLTEDKKYVTDIRLDMEIEIEAYHSLEWAIFEPADLSLCEKVGDTLDSLLRRKFDKGQLKGESADSAFFVKCDGEINTDDTLNQGMIIAEIGYAKKRPNEFTIIRIKQQVNG